MDILSTVLTVISTFQKVEPIVAASIKDFTPFATALYEQFKGNAPTDEEQAALEAAIDALAARLQGDLGPAQPGDPDYVAPT